VLPPPAIEPPFSELAGHAAWGATIGVGTFVTIELGPPSAAADGHGRYHLWIIHSAWRLSWQSDWVGSADSKSSMQLAVSSLNGCTLQRATCAEYGDLTLEFSNGQVLRTLADANFLDDSPWNLFTPTHTYFGIPRRGERWGAEPASEQR
jgi:hypothetical protein